MPQIRLVAVVCLSLLGCLVGCGGKSATSSLRLSTANAGELYRDDIPKGIADVRHDGQTDIVMTCETAGKATDCQPVRHTLHVRVLWQQGHAIKTQNKHQSQNAAIHWYVTPVAATDGSPQAPGLIEYHGSGLASVKRDGDEVVVTIDSSTVSASQVVGPQLADRLGVTTMRGTLRARQSPQETAAALGELRATVASVKRNAGGEARVDIEP